jgi:hypothetical protein
VQIPRSRDLERVFRIGGAVLRVCTGAIGIRIELLRFGRHTHGLFLIFWECYPLKVKKPKALSAFLKLKPDRAPVLRIPGSACDRTRGCVGCQENRYHSITNPS